MTNAFEQASLCDMPEFLCGHAQDSQAATGCSVVVAPEGATCGVDVRGGGPATRETDLLKPENMVEKVHAVVLSGGSAFGLAASTGVMEELASRGIGFEICGAHVPIVTGACLFDLPYGAAAYPDAAMGAAATRCAFAVKEDATLAAEMTARPVPGMKSEDARTSNRAGASNGSPSETHDGPAPLEGNIGAGCGATVGKMLAPEQATKSGLGICGYRLGDVVAVAMVAVNALGTVVNESGTPIAGHRDSQERIMNPLDPVLINAEAEANARSGNHGMRTGDADARHANAAAADPATAATNAGSKPCTNTTIGIVLTNATLTKAQVQKVSSIAHDAYARRIKPVHTSADGDTIFTMASGKTNAPFDTVAILATEAMDGAILRAVRGACAACGLPAARDLQG